MSGFEGTEPSSEEVVDIGTTLHSRDLQLIFNPRTGEFRVVDGEMENKSLRITVKSDSGSTYTITRKQGGVYENNSWFTWVRRRK